MLVRVEVACDPGHGGDEGEDGEADYEEDFVGHDVEQGFLERSEKGRAEAIGVKDGRVWVLYTCTFVS